MKTYQSFTLPYRLTDPQRAIRNARLDNIALVPASLLFQKERYKTEVSRLPAGSVLICTPAFQKQRQALAKVAEYFRALGHLVKTIPASQLMEQPHAATTTPA